jgi:hypothetical protein
MTLAEHYADLAEPSPAQPSKEESLTLRAEWESLADCYARLSQQSQSFDEAEHSSFLAELLYE